MSYEYHQFSIPPTILIHSSPHLSFFTLTLFLSQSYVLHTFPSFGRHPLISVPFVSQSYLLHPFSLNPYLLHSSPLPQSFLVHTLVPSFLISTSCRPHPFISKPFNPHSYTFIHHSLSLSPSFTIYSSYIHPPLILYVFYLFFRHHALISSLLCPLSLLFNTRSLHPSSIYSSSLSLSTNFDP